MTKSFRQASLMKFRLANPFTIRRRTGRVINGVFVVEDLFGGPYGCGLGKRKKVSHR